MSLPHEEGGIDGPHSVARPHRSHGERGHRSIQGAVGLRLTFSYTKEKLLMKSRYLYSKMFYSQMHPSYTIISWNTADTALNTNQSMYYYMYFNLFDGRLFEQN